MRSPELRPARAGEEPPRRARSARPPAAGRARPARAPRSAATCEPEPEQGPSHEPDPVFVLAVRLDVRFEAAENAGALRADLLAGGRLTKLVEACGRAGDADASPGDLDDTLRRYVPRPAEHSTRDAQPVEDVVRRVPSHLLDTPDVVAVRVDHSPARLDHQPADRVVGHLDGAAA